MYVTEHARYRLRTRFGADQADVMAAVLETWEGERGVVAYIASDLPAHVVADDGSNGDLLVIVAVDGSVESVYYRRSEQDISPKFFGARKVEDMRKYPVYREGA